MNFKNLHINKIVFFLFFIFSLSSYAQENESEIKKKAEKSFKSANYVEAGKLYAQLLAYNPRDFYYNYKYGICLIYNSDSKGDAIKYLKYATQDLKFDSEVYFYLGKAYHLNYEFSNALKNYDEYAKRLGTKENKELDVKRNIEMAKNGEKLLSSADEILVVDKKEIEKEKFFRSYDLKDIGGNILVTAQFQSKVDKKKNHIPIIYFASNPNVVYYSSYGENENTGKDIYYRTKKPDGNWSEPLLVKGGVNTKNDEDFPFFHAETGYLYFSSKGHNSMGGYDIFRCMFYPISKEFGPAENIDFPISSPDDDLFYVVDSMERNAYFASARQSLDGKIHVYNVKVKKVPIQFVVAKAKFSSISSPNTKNIVVEIFDVNSNLSISKNKSNETGSIFLTFPKPGNYEYRIKIEGLEEEFKIPVTISPRDGLKPLGQQIVHEKIESKDEVKILNVEGQDAEDLLETMAEIARMRSQMKPNVDQFDLQTIDNSARNQVVYSELGYTNLTDREVQEKIEELAVNQEKQFKNLKDLKQKALDDVVKNSNESKRLQEELKKIVETANTKTGSEKRELIEKGAAIVNELRRLDSENKSLVPFADSLTAPIELKEKDMLTAQRISTEIKSAFDEKNTDLMVERIKVNTIKIKEIQKVNSDLATEGIIKDIVEKKNDIAKITKEQDDLTSQKEKLKAEIAELKNQSLKAKSKEKNELNKQIANKEKEIDMIDEEIKSMEPKLVTKKANLDVQERKLLFIQSIQNSSEPLSNTTIAEAKAKSQNIDNPKAKELIQYIEDQSKELSIDMAAQKLDKKSTELSPNVGKEDLTYEQKKIVNEVAPNHTENVESIKKDEKLSNEEKHKLVLKEGKKAKFEVAKEIFETEEALKNDPYNKDLQTKLKELKNINESLRENIDTLHKEYTSNYVDPSLKYSVKESQLINRIKPNHFAELKAIESNPDYTEKKKLTESQKVDHDFIRNLTVEKIKLESQVKQSPNNPNNPKIKQELVALKKVTTDTDKRIATRNKSLATLTEYGDKKEAIISNEVLAEVVTPGSENSIEKTDNVENSELPSSSNEAKSNSKQELDAITSKLAPEYASNVKTIRYNNSLTSKQKEENLIKEEDKLINAIDLETQSTQTSLNSNPSDKELLAKKENLNLIKQQAEDRKRESEQVIISSIKSDLQKANIQGEVDPTYEKEVANLTLKKSKPGIIAREEKLQKNLQAKIDKNNANPTLKSNLNLIAENQVLNDLIDASKSRVFTLNESNSSIAKNSEKPNTESVNNTKSGDQLDNSSKPNNANIGADANEKKVELLNSVDPTYLSDVTKLANEKSVPEIINREEKLQTSLQAKITQNNKVKGNPKLVEENKVLTELIAESKSRTEVIKGTINNTTEINSNKSNNTNGVTTQPSKPNNEIVKSSDSVNNQNSNIQNNTNIATNETSKPSNKEENIGANASEKKVELLSAVDPTYLTDVTKLVESKSINDIVAREEKLQTSLKARITQNNKIKGNQKLIEENKILNELILESKSRADVVKGTNSSAVNDPIVANNQTESNNNLQNSTPKTNNVIPVTSKVEEKKVATINQVDPSFISEVNALIEQKSTHEIVLREQKLQQKLQDKIATNKNNPTFKTNQKLINDNKVLTGLYTESKARVATIIDTGEPAAMYASSKGETKALVSNTTAKPNNVNNKTVVEPSVSSSNNQNNTVSNESNNKNLVVENNSSDNNVNNSSTNNLSNENNSTNSKELEKTPVSVPIPYKSPVDASISKNKSDSLERERNIIASKEMDLNQKFNNPDIKKSERKAIAKELVQVQNEHNSILDKSNNGKAQLISEASQGAVIGDSPLEVSMNESAILAQTKIKQLESRNKELKKELAEIKDDRKKVPVLNEIRANNEKLSKLYTEVLDAKKIIKDATTLREIEPTLPTVSLISKESLYEYKSKVKSNLDSLVSEVAYSNQNLENSNIKNKDSIVAQIKELQGMLVVKTNEYKAIDQELRNRSTAPERTTIGTKNVEISMEDMNQITSLANYDAIKSSYEQKKVAEQSKEDKFKVFEQARDSYAEAVKKQNANPEIKNDEEVAILFEDLKAKTKDYSDALRRYQEMINAYKLLIQDKGDSAKIEQVINGAKPVDFNTVFSDYSWQIAKEAESFKLLDSQVAVPAKDRILPNDKIPTGLIYRVQVGALRKPLDENSFKEFSPITAEPLPNGISRYITGFFSTSQMANEVKNQIRQLGYKDAFVVAYCDGIRIPVEKALAMQNNNLCVPVKDFDKTVSLKVSSTATTVPVTTNAVKVNDTKPVEDIESKTNSSLNEMNSTLQLNEVKGVKVIDFAKYPEAVLGNSIDTMQGLFYTIQIGAFNRPANAQELKNIDNILYQLLEDGKIRYSTGVFNSVNEAFPAKKDVIAKGIADAFVAVYYQGKRITFQEAAELIERNGEGILQKK